MNTILVLAYRRPYYLAQLLDGLLENDLRGYDVKIVFDNAKTDDVPPLQIEQLRKIESMPFDIEVVCRPKNLGPNENCFASILECMEYSNKLLYFEDDIIPLRGCIHWMNWALDNVDTPSVNGFSITPRKDLHCGGGYISRVHGYDETYIEPDPSAYRIMNFWMNWALGLKASSFDLIKPYMQAFLDDRKTCWKKMKVTSRHGTRFMNSDEFISDLYNDKGYMSAIPVVTRALNVGIKDCETIEATKACWMKWQPITSNDFPEQETYIEVENRINELKPAPPLQVQKGFGVFRR